MNNTLFCAFREDLSTNTASEFVFDAIMEDIVKYMNPRYNEIDMSNYFFRALCNLYSHATEEAFNAGVAAMLDVIKGTAPTPACPGKLRDEYKLVCGTIREVAS